MIFKEIYPELTAGKKIARMKWHKENFYIKWHDVIEDFHSYHLLLQPLNNIQNCFYDNDYICLTDDEKTEVSFIEAIEGMKAGKEYCKSNHPEIQYILAGKDLAIRYLDSVPYALTSEDVLANDWVVVE